MKIVNHRKITRIMVNATKDVLHEGCKEWLDKNHPNRKLEIKIGSGKSTYHRENPTNRHKIVFGTDMVRETMESEYVSSKWTHGDEIVERNYFNGDLSPQNMMVAAIIHEYAHFIQVIMGYRTRKSVHNKEFYEILDRMHNNGHAIRVLNNVMQFPEFQEMKYKHAHKKGMDIIYDQSNLSEGMMLTFVGKEKAAITGIIKRTSKRTVSVSVPGRLYRVPYHLITKVM
jgi:hypothetical protein